MSVIASELYETQLSGASITIGIMSCILSSACQSIGLILQRKSHLIYEHRTRGNYKPPYKRSLWRIGFSLFLISNIFGSSIQITTLPLIILSPLQSIGLVFNSLFSSLVLNEVFTRNSFFGTVMICVGALLIATFGRLPEPNYNLNQFIELLQRKTFTMWWSFNLMVVSALLTWILLSINSGVLMKVERAADSVLIEEHQMNTNPLIDELENYSHYNAVNAADENVPLDSHADSNSRDEESVLLNNDNYINATTSNEYQRFHQGDRYENNTIRKWVLSIGTTVKNISKRISSGVYRTVMKSTSVKNTVLLQGVFFGWISGTLSAFSLLLAKSTIEILLNCITTKSNLHEVLKRPMIWIIVASFFILCLSQLWFLNQGLKLVTTSILYPLVFCVYNIVNIGNELIFFNQWSVVSAWQLLNICTGTLFVLLGVALLSWRLEEFSDVQNAEAITVVAATTNSNVARTHPHLHNHQRKISLGSVHTISNKRVGLSSFLNVKSPLNTQHEQFEESERSSVKTTPNFKSYFTFNNSSTPQKNVGRTTPGNSRFNHSLTINTSSDNEYEEGHSEYISFGSPNDRSPVDFPTTPVLEEDHLVSPLSTTAKRSLGNIHATQLTPTRLRNHINGFQATDIDQSSNLSNTSISDVQSTHTTPKKRYGSLGNIFSNNAVNGHTSNDGISNNHNGHNKSNINTKVVGSSGNPNTPQKRHAKRFLSFEQNELLNQLRNN